MNYRTYSDADYEKQCKKAKKLMELVDKRN